MCAFKKMVVYVFRLLCVYVGMIGVSVCTICCMMCVCCVYHACTLFVSVSVGVMCCVFERIVYVVIIFKSVLMVYVCLCMCFV